VGHGTRALVLTWHLRRESRPERNGTEVKEDSVSRGERRGMTLVGTEGGGLAFCGWRGHHWGHKQGKRRGVHDKSTHTNGEL